MTVKATQFRKNLFRYLDQCRDTGMVVVIERGGDRFRLKAEGKRKPVGSAAPRPGAADDLYTLPDFSPAEWTDRDFS